jgi:transcriptional regulator with XRE-family HTH domain
VGRSRLPILLKAKRLKQVEFATMLGISEAFVSQIIKGVRYFSYPTALNAAYILGCSMEELHEPPLKSGNRQE